MPPEIEARRLPLGESILRWVLFLPLAMVAVSVLELIPQFGAALLGSLYVKDMSVLQLVILVVAIMFALGFVWFWFMLVYCSPFICRLAPNPQIAVVIFATLYVLSQGSMMIGMALDGRWMMFGYKVVISGLILIGCVAAYDPKTAA